jgi:hypothetical protein
VTGFTLSLSADHPSQPTPSGSIGEVADARYDAAVSEPFFDIDKCISAALSAAVRLRKTAWEHRRRGEMAEYRRLVENAVFYRKRSRIWRMERDG